MDPAKCLEILGRRGTCGGSHGGHGHQSETGCTNENIPAELAASQAAAEEAARATASASAVRAGQVINLATGANETQAAREAVQAMSSALASSSGADGGTAPLPSANGNGDGGGERVTSDARGRDGAKPEVDGAKEGDGGVLEGLRGMSTGGLVKSFRRAQEERVALYKKFNGGLKDALRSGDYSGYPALCCDVTAGFSVLSKAVNAIEVRLNSKPATKAIGYIIRKVQGHEEQLLTLTAAHHLESMREAKALGMGPGMEAHVGGRNGDANPVSPKYDGLLREGVGQLSRRAAAEAEAVTELLEELRHEAEGVE